MFRVWKSILVIRRLHESRLLVSQREAEVHNKCCFQKQAIYMKNLMTKEKGFVFMNLVGEKGTYDEEP